jgi:SET domain
LAVLFAVFLLTKSRPHVRQHRKLTHIERSKQAGNIGKDISVVDALRVTDAMRFNATICSFSLVWAHFWIVFHHGASALVPTSSNPADDLMHSWCESIGVEINPSVRLMTTPASVAGRGVFATEALEEFETIAYIPTYAMFHPRNGRNMFPDVADGIRERMNRSPTDGASSKKPKKKKFLGRILRRLFQRQNKKIDGESEEAPWQVELTEYALAALSDDHPFEPWIRQWRRDDPVQRLFEKEAPTVEDVQATAAELHNLAPHLSLYKILAALNIRLETYENFKPLFRDPSPRTAAMLTTVTSRTIGLTDDITSVVPFHDMLNHDFQPNVGLGFSDDGRKLVLFAREDIPAGQELFLSYTTTGKEYSEDAAVWILVQWGIPVSEAEWEVATPGLEYAASQSR